MNQMFKEVVQLTLFYARIVFVQIGRSRNVPRLKKVLIRFNLLNRFEPLSV